MLKGFICKLEIFLEYAKNQAKDYALDYTVEYSNNYSITISRNRRDDFNMNKWGNSLNNSSFSNKSKHYKPKNI